MPLSLEQKKDELAEIKVLGDEAMSSVLVDYRGISSNQMTDLRKKARTNNIKLKVLRNRLAKQAFKGNNLSCVEDILVGPTLLATSTEDLGAPARLIKEFIDENKILEVKGLTVQDQFLKPEKLKEVTSLPTYEQAIATLMSMMLAPATALARALNETVAKLVRTVSAIEKTKS